MKNQQLKTDLNLGVQLVEEVLTEISQVFAEKTTWQTRLGTASGLLDGAIVALERLDVIERDEYTGPPMQSYP